jgi:hypothetical protein
MIYCDYPTYDFKRDKDGVSMKVKGDQRLTCRLMIVKKDKVALPDISIYQHEIEVSGTHRRDGNMEYAIHGKSHLKISWK